VSEAASMHTVIDTLIIAADRLNLENNNNNARLYQLGLNLGITILRSEDIPRFILGLSCNVL